MKKLKKFLYQNDTQNKIFDEMLNNIILSVDISKSNIGNRYFIKSEDEILVLPKEYLDTCPHRFKDNVKELSDYTLLNKNNTYSNSIIMSDFNNKLVYMKEHDEDFAYSYNEAFTSNLQLIYLGKSGDYDVVGLFRSVVMVDHCFSLKSYISKINDPNMKGILFYEAYFIKKDELITYNKLKDRFFKRPKHKIDGLTGGYLNSPDLTIKSSALSIINKYTDNNGSETRTYKQESNPLLLLKDRYLKDVSSFKVDNLNQKDFDFIQKSFTEKISTINFYRYNVEKREMHTYVFSQIGDKIKLSTEAIVSTDKLSATYMQDERVYRGFPKIGPIFKSLDSEKELRNKFEELGFNKYGVHDLYMNMFDKDYHSMYVWKDSFPRYISKYPKLELLLKDKNKGIIAEMFERNIKISKYLDLNKRKPNQIYMLNNNKINILNIFLDNFGYTEYNLDMLIVLNVCDKIFEEDYDYEIYEKVYLLTSGGSNNKSVELLNQLFDLQLRDEKELSLLKSTFFNYYYENINSGSIENESFFSMIYNDYINFVMDLELDLTPEVLMPKYLLREHDVLADLVAKNTNEIEKKNFIKHMNSVSYLKEHPEDSMFTIVLPEDPIDLINEGNTLHHCVGGYINRVSDYSSIILFIRQKDKIQQPLYTLEYRYSNKSKKLVRGDFRGSYNCIPSSKAQAFVNKFEKYHGIS